MVASMKVRRQLAFVKVLAGLAWADGVLSRSEINRIKNFIRHFGIPDEFWPEVEMVLAERIDEETCLAHVSQFLELAPGSAERRLLTDAMEEMAMADGSVTSDEQAFIQRISTALADASSPRSFLKGMKGVFKTLLRGPDEMSGGDDELTLFNRNPLLFKCRQRLQPSDTELDDSRLERLERATLAGGLLGVVLETRGSWSEREVSVLLEQVVNLSGLPVQEAETAVLVIQEAGRARELDQPRLAHQLFEVSSPAERTALVGAMFQVAASGGEPATHQQIEQIRRVTKVLGVSHDDFVRARVRSMGHAD